MNAKPQERERSARDRWIPWSIVAGFAVVILVNGIMIYIAVASFTGLQTEEHYKRGLEYNRVLEADRAQEALGWTVGMDVEQIGERRVHVSLQASDSQGNPLNGANVNARLVRPVQAGHDMDVSLVAAGNGTYETDVELPLQGQWDILAQITHRSGSYRTAKRIVAQ